MEQAETAYATLLSIFLFMIIACPVTSEMPLKKFREVMQTYINF